MYTALKNSLLATVVLLFFSFVTYSQNQMKIDSLHQVLSADITDSKRVEVWNAIAHEYRDQDSLNTAHYTEKAISLGQKIGYFRGVADAYRTIGIATFFKSDKPQALMLIDKALQVAKSHDYKRGEANVYTTLGVIYWQEGNYPKALEYYLQALKSYEQTGDKHGMANAYNNIGIIYHKQSNNQQALDYFTQSLELRRLLGDQNGEATSYNNLGSISKDQREYQKALAYYNKSLDIREDLGDKRGMSSCYTNLGDIYTILKNYQKAVEYHQRAFVLFQEIGAKADLSYPLIGIGKAHLHQKQYTKAINNFQQAIDISIETDIAENIRDASEGLSSAYKSIGNYQKAYENHVLYKTMSDSLQNEESIQKTTSQQMQYEFDKQQAIAQAEREKQALIHKQEIEQKNYLLYGGVLVMLSILLVSIFIYKSYREKQAVNKLLTQQNEEIKEQSLKIETERQKSEKLLLNILPRATAKELKEKGYATPKLYEKVSILFTDFKGFTKIAEQMSEEEVVANLDYCFKSFDEIIKKYGLEKIKTIGDAYMCAGGIPEKNKSNPEDAIMAAQEIVRFMQKWKRAKEEKGEDIWEVRIGIHTGKVIAGVVGKDKFAYDIWGDTVNIASRMESSGEVGKINISGDTYTFVKDRFSCVYRGKITAKNKGEVEMYFVES